MPDGTPGSLLILQVLINGTWYDIGMEQTFSVDEEREQIDTSVKVDKHTKYAPGRIDGTISVDFLWIPYAESRPAQDFLREVFRKGEEFQIMIKVDGQQVEKCPVLPSSRELEAANNEATAVSYEFQKNGLFEAV